MAHRSRISIKVGEVIFLSTLSNLRCIGIDAMERVLHKANKGGPRAFGHSYKKSIKDRAGLAAHV